MRILNLGILAHVDAGKTSLTERLLHAAGVIDEIGSVDDGNTQTDTLALERRRGITIKSAVVSFVIGDVTVNLIDTPGHPDFIAEVERVLSVLDGAVLVISAVEGVQPQTRVLMRTLRRLRIPALLFVNKIDRRGARYDGVLREITAALTPAIVPMGPVRGLGTRDAVFTPYTPADAAFTSRLAEVLADHDDDLLAAYVHEETTISHQRLRTELAAQTRKALTHPVFFGSAITGAGVGALVDGLREWLPAGDGDADAPASGTVFKIERGPAGEKIAYVRMFAGTIRVRDRLPVRSPSGNASSSGNPALPATTSSPGTAISSAATFPTRTTAPAGTASALRTASVARSDTASVSGSASAAASAPVSLPGNVSAVLPAGGADGPPGGKGRAGAGGGSGDGGEGKVTAIRVFDRGSAVPSSTITGGRIGMLWGLGDVRIGDMLGAPRTPPAEHHFAPPTLETVVVPCRPADRAALHLALTRLAEQDPLIGLRQDDVRQEISVSLYGEVQKEVVQATLADEFGIDVTFRESTTICVERPVGAGAAVEFIDTPPNPFLATVGLRVEPAPPGTGVDFRLGVELGSMPFTFFRAVEETVRRTLGQGLHGWQVIDCAVVMTHAGYWPRQSHAHAVFDKSMSSTAGDFRNLTPLVLMSALAQAGTRVHEPVQRFTLELPADTLGSALPVLARLRAVPRTTTTRGASALVEGEVPAAHVHELQQRLPALTRGEGVLECAFGGYRPVTGPVPDRPRTDHNPLDREEYLLHVVRGV